MSYLDNDDDLFEYDPELEEESSHSSDQLTSTKTNSKFEDFVSKSKVDDDLDLSSNELLDQAKLKLALAFHKATHHHFSSVESPAYHKAITLVLDKITNGDFSLIYMFYRKEALLAQRLIFLSMMDAIADTSKDDEENILSEILSHLNIKLTPLHIDLYYGTSIAICRHTLVVDRVIYQHLGEKLSIPTNEFIVDPNYNYSLNPDPVSQIINTDIYTKIFESITSSLADEGILEKLQETFGSSVRLFKNV